MQEAPFFFYPFPTLSSMMMMGGAGGGATESSPPLIASGFFTTKCVKSVNFFFMSNYLVKDYVSALVQKKMCLKALWPNIHAVDRGTGRIYH
jgi:hypothetical protein